MITQILPGLREFRAPLLTGYILLIAVWLYLWPALPKSERQSRERFEAFYDLADATGRVGIVIATSVVAYFVGLLWLRVTSSLIGAVAPRLRQLGVIKVEGIEFKIISKEAATSPAGVPGPTQRSIEPPKRYPGSDQGLWAQGQIRNRLLEARRALKDGDLRASDEADYLISHVDQMETEHGWETDKLFRRLSFWIRLASEEPWKRWYETTTRRVMEEMTDGSTADRLRIANKDLYGAYIKLEAEADVRIGTATALAIMLPAALLRAGLLWWASLAAALVAILAIGGILFDGITLQRRQYNYLKALVETRTVLTPTLDDLEQLLGHSEDAN